MIHEDAGKTVADGAVEQDASHAGIDAARESEDDTVLPQLLLQFLHGSIHERSGTPLLTRAADVNHKIVEQRFPLHGVEHLGMELNGKYPTRTPRGGGAPEGGILHILRAADNLEAVGNLSDGVTMTHPYLRVLVKTMKQRICCVYRLKIGTTILTAVGFLHLAAQGMADVLCSIADAEYRHAAYELTEVNLECLGVVDTERRTTEDDADDGTSLQVVRNSIELVVRQDLAESVKLTDTTAYKLGGL